MQIDCDHALESADTNISIYRFKPESITLKYKKFTPVIGCFKVAGRVFHTAHEPSSSHLNPSAFFDRYSSTTDLSSVTNTCVG